MPRPLKLPRYTRSVFVNFVTLQKTQVISTGFKGKGNTYFLKKERWFEDSRYHRKISRICIDKELRTTRINSDYKYSDLAVVELERSFPNMDNFHSPLWSQPNQIFYPQDSEENGKKGKMLLTHT